MKSASMVLMAIGMIALPACDAKSDKPGESAAASASGSNHSASGAAVPEPEPSPDRPAVASPITAKIVDVQWFHPSSRQRAMAGIRADDQLDLMESTERFGDEYEGDITGEHGAGVLVEAINETEMLLYGATFEAEIELAGKHGSTTCKIVPDRYRAGVYQQTYFLSYFEAPASGAPMLSFDGTPKKPPLFWNESVSHYEKVWRPGERIRLLGRRHCVSSLANDLDPTTIRGKVTVKAFPAYSSKTADVYTHDQYAFEYVPEGLQIVDRATKELAVAKRQNIAKLDVDDKGVVRSVRLHEPVLRKRTNVYESEGIPFEFHPHVLGVQKVALPSGEEVHAAGNVAVFVDKEQVVFRDLAALGIDMGTMKRADLPATSPEVSVNVDELSVLVSKIALFHYTEDKTLMKGTRSLNVTLKLSMPAASLDARLRAPVDVAKAALEQADAAAAGLGESAEPAAKAAAAAAAKAKATFSAAESMYKSATASERGRLARAISCGDIRLVTSASTGARATNATDVSRSCAEIAKQDDVEVTLRYVLGRYERPVALAYRFNGKAMFSPIASLELMKIDAR